MGVIADKGVQQVKPDDQPPECRHLVDPGQGSGIKQVSRASYHIVPEHLMVLSDPQKFTDVDKSIEEKGQPVRCWRALSSGTGSAATAGTAIECLKQDRNSRTTVPVQGFFFPFTTETRLAG